MPRSAETAPTIWTIGHSTRPIEALIAALRAHRITRLVDIRTIPRSRHNPQFESTALAVALPAAGIVYEHRPGLGGLRRPQLESPNRGWRNASFRGFADYMQTTAFVQEIEALSALAGTERVAIMCAEAVPWRCHRSLVADALTARGVAVEHILDERHSQPHKLTPFARVDGLRVTYPPAEGALL